MSGSFSTSWERAISDALLQPRRGVPGHEARSPQAEAERLNQIAPLRAEATVSAVSSANRIDLDAAAVTRPFWSRDRLPVQTTTPILANTRPVLVDRFVLRPSPDENIVYVAPTEVSLVSFSLTLHRSVLSDRSIAITGGTASLCVSAYAPTSLKSITLLRRDWSEALTRNNFSRLDWSFRAEQRRGLSVSLELPPGIAASSPLISTSPLAGVATVSVELTETGALTWKAALEQGAGSTIAGILHVSTSALGLNGVVMRLDRRSLDTTIGSLLASRSTSDIHYVDPQQALVGRLIVVTSDLVDKISVSLRPSEGPAPTGQAFGPEGGEVDVTVTTQNVSSVTVDWSAQVTFTPIGWSLVPALGQLNAANGWTNMVKPDSWIANYTFMAIPVDERGQAQSSALTDTTRQMQGVLTFTAPYVANGLITSSFRTEYLQISNIALPLYPSQPPGDVVLTVFATRNGKGGMKSRKLSPADLNVVALIHPDASVEIRTGSDALSEMSTASDSLRLLEAL